MLWQILVAALAAAQAQPQSPPPQAQQQPQQQTQRQQQPPPLRPPTRADILRGEYGRYRANNDLLFYHLDVRVDPDKKYLSGKTTIRFRMLKDDNRIQLDLYDNLKVDKILLVSPKSNVQDPI